MQTLTGIDVDHKQIITSGMRFFSLLHVSNSIENANKYWQIIFLLIRWNAMHWARVSLLPRHILKTNLNKKWVSLKQVGNFRHNENSFWPILLWRHEISNKLFFFIRKWKYIKIGLFSIDKIEKKGTFSRKKCR